MVKADDTSKRLKLRAMDEEDLPVLSALVQDAVLKVGDLQYLAGEKRFVLALNRFVWESAATGGKSKKRFERRRAALHFETVTGVKAMGINRTDADTVLSLLAIEFHASESPAGDIELVFAGDGAVRLTVECIEAQLSDLDAAWQTGSKPNHDTDG